MRSGSPATAKKVATFFGTIFANKELSANALAFTRLVGGKGGELSGQLQIRYQTLTHPLTLIPGQTAYHVILIKRSQMIYYPTIVPELTSVSPENVTAGSVKTISQQQQTPEAVAKQLERKLSRNRKIGSLIHHPLLTCLVADVHYSSTALDAHKMALHSRFIIACRSPYQRWYS